MNDESQVIKVKFTNGDEYIGKFKNEQFHGDGEYHFANGNKYIGNFSFGEFTGKGTYHDSVNGITIEANFRKNQPENPVRLTNTQEGSEYYGDIVENIREGKGIFKFPKKVGGSGYSMYEGDFFNNRFHGKGKLYWDHGGHYEGDFQYDEMTGNGMYADDECRYEGEFLAGRKHGKGRIIYKKTGESYEGGFKNDKKEGQGVYMYKDKSVYKGPFVEDKKQGKGELTFSNGQKYIGGFKEGVFHGKGILNLDGCNFEGEFKENEADGEGIVDFDNGNKLIANFRQNMKMGSATCYVETKGRLRAYHGEFSYNVENVNKANFGSRF